MERNTCPKPLKYSARANKPADEQFKKDIKAIKQNTEHGFFKALTKFHYRRLEKQKLQKEMSIVNRKGRKDSKNVNVSTTEDHNEIKALVSKLKEQYDYIMSKLNSDNKNCEKYSQVSVKCVNNTVGGSNKITGKSFSRKIQRQTATRKERRKSLPRKESVIKTIKGENVLRTSQPLKDTFITKFIFLVTEIQEVLV